MMPKKQFEQWVRSQLFVALDNGFCKKLVLKHVTSASRMGHVVLSIEVPSEPDDNWVEETCQHIEQTAQGDADGVGGTQTYVVQSFHGEILDRPSARFSLRMNGQASPEEDDVSSEPPTKSGLLSQTMRHLEAVMRTSALVQASAMTAMQRTLDKQERTIEKLLDEKFDNLDTVENLLSRKTERDIAAAEAQKKMELKDKMVDKFLLLAPTAVNRLLGSGKQGQAIVPEQTTPMEQQLASLAETMQMDQIEKLQTVFTAEQMMVFIDIFQQIQKKQMALAAKPQALPQEQK